MPSVRWWLWLSVVMRWWWRRCTTLSLRTRSLPRHSSPSWSQVSVEKVVASHFNLLVAIASSVFLSFLPFFFLSSYSLSTCLFLGSCTWCSFHFLILFWVLHFQVFCFDSFTYPPSFLFLSSSSLSSSLFGVRMW